MDLKIRRIESKCNSCMRCVKDCASGVWRDTDGIPEASAEELCNQCGHCMAVCPKSAIENEFLDADQVRRVRKKLLDPHCYKETVLSRRSIRQFQNKPVDPEVITSIINVAGYSPTASNSQHVGYIVITCPDRLKKISDAVFSIAEKLYKWSRTRSGVIFFKGLKINSSMGQMIQKYIEPMEYYLELKKSGRDLILHNAPVLILLHGPSYSFFASDNCNIAAANITNYAHCLGLGSCYIGFVTLASRFNKNLSSLTGLPKGRNIYSSIVLGHPAYPHPFTTSRKKADVKQIS